MALHLSPNKWLQQSAAIVFARYALASKHCSADIVKTHRDVRGTATARAINTLVNSVQSIRERRNAHVHRGERADIAEVEALGTDDFLWLVKAMSFIEGVKPSTFDASIVRAGWREVAKVVAPRLREEATGVISGVVALFDALLPAYIKRSDLLLKIR